MNDNKLSIKERGTILGITSLLDSISAIAAVNGYAVKVHLEFEEDSPKFEEMNNYLQSIKRGK